MWSVEMRASRPRNATVLSSGIAASIGATSVATADRPLAASRSRTVFRYWMVDSFTSGETPGSPPPDGQAPKRSGLVGTGALPAVPVPPVVPAVPATVPSPPLPPLPGALPAILPSHASRPDAAATRATAISGRRGQGRAVRILQSTNPEPAETVQGPGTADYPNVSPFQPHIAPTASAKSM